MTRVPLDLLDRIKQLERQVHQLSGRTQMRPAMNEITGGTVTIGDGGKLLVRAPDGTEHLTLGALPTTYGTPEFGLIVRRRDGSTALSIWNGDTAAAPQVLRITDAKGNPLLVEDVTAGGLSKPWLPYPTPTAESVTAWPQTSDSAWTTLQRSRALIQHPRIRASASLSGPGQLRICVNETPVITGADGQPLAGIGDVPSYLYDMDATLTLQARVTTGPGPVYAMTRYLYGVGSA
ncbi:hypothetical protein ACIQV3_11365 [Streptomyces sp. NPDC099050]|uniref:hypothetical protein n=1 Tax=Streptomyces sp. NPDC099050 TaxID=3366100 RepID=UPI0037FAA1B0